jgi:NAD(P) transhydrogenase subunit alpha
MLGIGLIPGMPASFMQHFIVFVLSVFIGFQVIWNVAHSLHTPLMAVTNAISSIIILGALIQIGSSSNFPDHAPRRPRRSSWPPSTSSAGSS